MTTLCKVYGCDSVGVFPAPTDDDPQAMACFVHDTTPAPAADAPTIVDAAPSFHVDVTAGLAAMILEHTAMTVLEVDDAAGEAMRSLAANTALPADVCAGIILATTWIMAAGEVDADALLRGAELYESEAEREDDDEAGDEARDECDECNGFGKCPRCMGTGTDDSGDECADCDGDGTCQECMGTGEVMPIEPAAGTQPAAVDALDALDVTTWVDIEDPGSVIAAGAGTDTGTVPAPATEGASDNGQA